MLMNWKERLWQLLYPAYCPGCGTSVSRHGQWCGPCLGSIWNPRRINRSREITHLDGCYCLADYRGAMRHILHRIKYNGDLKYDKACQTLLYQFPWMKRLSAIDMVMPVPLFPEKEKSRGFNQAALIFQPWAETYWPWCDGLQRVRMTEAQWQLARQERKSNVKRAFEVKDSVSVSGKHILVVDDIYTTGITLDACARALKEKKAASVTGLVIASGAR